MQLAIQSNPVPKSVRLWTAHSEDLDFRPDHWEPSNLDPGADGRFVGHIKKPASGHVAFFGEARYEYGDLEYALSTQIRQK
jgi:hypothetical protein